MRVSLSSNCQWDYKHYGVYDINQLSQKQLNEYLSWTKENIIGWSILTGPGTAGITALAIDANNAHPGDLSVAIIFLD